MLFTFAILATMAAQAMLMVFFLLWLCYYAALILKPSWFILFVSNNIIGAAL